MMINKIKWDKVVKFRMEDKITKKIIEKYKA